MYFVEYEYLKWEIGNGGNLEDLEGNQNRIVDSMVVVVENG